jgi:hypothetical protein
MTPHHLQYGNFHSFVKFGTAFRFREKEMAVLIFWVLLLSSLLLPVIWFVILRPLLLIVSINQSGHSFMPANCLHVCLLAAILSCTRNQGLFLEANRWRFLGAHSATVRQQSLPVVATQTFF